MKERNDCDAPAKRDPDGVMHLCVQLLSPPLTTTTTVIATTTTFDQRLLFDDILNVSVFMGHLRVHGNERFNIHGSLKCDVEMNVSVFTGHLRVTWK